MLRMDIGFYIGTILCALLTSLHKLPIYDPCPLGLPDMLTVAHVLRQDLKEVLGNDLGGILESALVQKGLRRQPKSP